MPQLPGFLTPLTRIFGAPAQVVTIEELGPWLRRAHFAGEALRGKGWRPGQEVEFHVGDGAMRHYTPADWDAARGRFSVVFHLHGHGPGSRWAAGLGVGDAVRVMGPGGRFGMVAARRHLVVGDETALGFGLALRAAQPAASHCVFEVDEDAGAARRLLPGADVVRRAGDRGEALAEALRGAARPGDVAYLVGHAGTMTRLRRLWIDELRQPAGAARVKAYWADGRRGL
ncbi:MAG: siderophore-interacting protein [Myxococcales bacterium]|nr:siderophore-interacting protein [Myxococcales bacterium]